MNLLFILSSFVMLPTYGANQPGLILNAVDARFGRFQREDNRIRHYPPSHPFLVAAYRMGDRMPHDLKELQLAMSRDPGYRRNPDGTYSFFYFSFEQLLRGIQNAPKSLGSQISLLNLHTEGFPGGIHIPKDFSDASPNGTCGYIIKAMISETDQVAYNQYYWGGFANAKDAAQWIKGYFADSHAYAENPASTPSLSECGVTPSIWRSYLKLPQFEHIAESFSSTARMRFVACHTGLGKEGGRLSQVLDQFLFSKSRNVEIVSPAAYAMSDWSAKEGILFFDYHGDDSEITRKMETQRSQHQDSLISSKEPVLRYLRTGTQVSSSLPRIKALPIR